MLAVAREHAVAIRLDIRGGTGTLVAFTDTLLGGLDVSLVGAGDTQAGSTAVNISFGTSIETDGLAGHGNPGANGSGLSRSEGNEAREDESS